MGAKKGGKKRRQGGLPLELDQRALPRFGPPTQDGRAIPKSAAGGRSDLL